MRVFIFSIMAVLFSCGNKIDSNKCFFKCGEIKRISKSGIYYPDNFDPTWVRIRNTSLDTIIYSIDDFEVKKVIDYPKKEIVLHAKNNFLFHVRKLDSVFVKEGQKIRAGEKIGLVKNSANFIYANMLNNEGLSRPITDYLNCNCAKKNNASD